MLTPRSHSTPYTVVANQSYHVDRYELGELVEADWVTGEYPARTVQSYMSGYSIDHYHRRRKRGELLPFTPFDQVYIRLESVIPCSFTYFNPVGDGSTYHNTSTRGGAMGLDSEFVYWPDSSDLSSYGLFHLQQAAAAMYSSGYDALTALAEIGSVRKLFLKLAKRLSDLVSNPNIRNISDAWLEGRYGWRTLLYDIQDLASAINKLNNTPIVRRSERKGESLTLTSDDINVRSDNADFTSIEYVTRESRISIRGSVVADFIPPRFQFNVPRTAWELLPLSFVVDWLFNVGMAIEANSFVTFASNHASGWGYRREDTVTVSETATAKASPAANTHSGGTTEMVLSRVIERRFIAPVPKLPIIKVRLDTLKVMDLLALVRQRL